jgi:hypothetical protein
MKQNRKSLSRIQQMLRTKRLLAQRKTRKADARARLILVVDNARGGPLLSPRG